MVDVVAVQQSVRGGIKVCTLDDVFSIAVAECCKINIGIGKGLSRCITYEFASSIEIAFAYCAFVLVAS